MTFSIHDDFFKTHMLIFHAVIEEQSLIPLWKRSFKASSPFSYLLESHLYSCIRSIKLKMLITIRNLLVSTSLILKSIEKSISMHVDSSLLIVKSLTISSHVICHDCIHVHHLLLLEFIIFVLKIFDSIERGLSNGNISCGSNM